MIKSKIRLTAMQTFSVEKTVASNAEIEITFSTYE